jgi:hypothetical protein
VGNPAGHDGSAKNVLISDGELDRLDRNAECNQVIDTVFYGQPAAVASGPLEGGLSTSAMPETDDWSHLHSVDLQDRTGRRLTSHRFNSGVGQGTQNCIPENTMGRHTPIPDNTTISTRLERTAIKFVVDPLISNRNTNLLGLQLCRCRTESGYPQGRQGASCYQVRYVVLLESLGRAIGHQTACYQILSTGRESPVFRHFRR